MEAEGFVHRQEPLPLQDGVDLPVPERRPKRRRSRSALVEPAAKRGVLAKAKAKPEGKAKAKAKAKAQAHAQAQAQAQAPAAAAGDVAAFTPVKITDGTRCLARVWAGGHGGQCSWPPAQGQHLCRRHLNNSSHGLVTGGIPEAKLAAFLRANPA